MPPTRSTAPETPSLGRLRRARAGRRAGIAVLMLLVLAAASGLLGPRTAESSASGEGYELLVRYPDVARAGLPVHWDIEIRRDGDFDGPVVVAVPSAYLELYDAPELIPAPSVSSATGDRALWTFEPPPGDRLTVTVDTRVAPGRYRGSHGFVAVMGDGRDVVRVDLTTRLVP